MSSNFLLCISALSYFSTTWWKILTHQIWHELVHGGPRYFNGGVIRYLCGRISGPHEPIPTNLGCGCFSSCSTYTWYSKRCSAKKKKKKNCDVKASVLYNAVPCGYCKLEYNVPVKVNCIDHRLIKTQIGYARDFTWYRGQRPSPARVILSHEPVQIHARENLCS